MSTPHTVDCAKLKLTSEKRHAGTDAALTLPSGEAFVPYAEFPKLQAPALHSGSEWTNSQAAGSRPKPKRGSSIRGSYADSQKLGKLLAGAGRRKVKQPAGLRMISFCLHARTVLSSDSAQH